MAARCSAPRRRRLGAALTAVLLATAGVSLGACGKTFEERVHEDLAHTPTTVVATDVATIYSPFDGSTTDNYARSIDRAGRRVAQLLEVDPAGIRLQVQLVPYLPPDQGDPVTSLLLATQQGREGWHGYVVQVNGEDWIVVYVPDIPDAGFQGVYARQNLLAHELAHAMRGHADLPPDGPRWFEEGLAEVVEVVPLDDAGDPRFDGPAPPSLHIARALARRGDVKRLLRWSRVRAGSRLDPEEEAQLYPLAMAFTYYLMAESGDGSFLQRARTCRQLPSDELRQVEDDWLAWLAELDMVEDVAGLLATEDEWLHRQAIGTLASVRHPDLAQRRFVEAALDATSRLETYFPASVYLIRNCEDHLTVDDIAALTDSPDPARCLLGLALRQRRGELVDAQRQAACETALPAAWDEPTMAIRLLLDEPERVEFVR